MTPRGRWQLLAGVALLAVSVLVVVGWPLADAARFDRPTWSADGVTMGHRFHAHLLTLLMGVWFFALGASFGSFLNVVAWRMPRGMSLVAKGSRCPYCDTPIRATDNVPVLGWLRLRGRCRTCRLPIHPRYFLVETIAGTMFLGLGFVELLAGGRNLPMRMPRAYTGFGWLVWATPWDLIGFCLYHVTLLCLLLTCALIKLDRQALPRRLLAFGAIVGLAAPAIWPWLHPVPWAADLPDWLDALPWAARIDTSLVGLAAGGGLGMLLALGQRQSGQGRAGPGRSARPETAALLALVGLFLGWQAALSIAVLTAASHLLLTIALTIARQPIHVPLALTLGPATFAHLLAWRALWHLRWWPGTDPSPRAILIACAGLAAAGAATRLSSATM
jgi:leader peptidase (prepilin peptidase)/N-methyltransferase